MKTVISVAIALALMLSVVPAMAGDTPAMAGNTFQAFTQMSADEQARLTPLDNDQLAAVEGMLFDVCVRCANIAVVRQRNVNIRGAAVQTNLSLVGQSIN